MLEITYAFAGYIMGAISLLISLYVWLTVDEMKKNGVAWIELNRQLKKKIENMEKTSPISPWKK